MNTNPTHNFFFNDTATTEIYTLSLHDALPILTPSRARFVRDPPPAVRSIVRPARNRDLACRAAAGRPEHDAQSVDQWIDRKSTRLNSSHDQISYAVFCLKKKQCP